MASTEDCIRVNQLALADFCRAALCSIGLASERVQLVAHVLVRNEMRGIGSHGVACLGKYMRHAQGGGIDVASVPTLVSDGPAFALVAVRTTAHFAAAGYYAMMATEAGMIGLATSNSDPTVSATDTHGRSIGNNPIAFAVPGPGWCHRRHGRSIERGRRTQGSLS